MIKVGLTYPFSFNQFKKVFPTLELVSNPQDVKYYDLLLFPGGEDVSPSFYGDNNRFSSCSEERDEIEREIFIAASKLNKKMLGICRGSQFLNVMSGGTLYQDITYEASSGHNFFHTWDKIRPHKILTIVPGIINSTHHQGIKYYGENLIGIADHKGVPEITLSLEGNIVMLQFHPESMNNCQKLFSYINDWVEQKEEIKPQVSTTKKAMHLKSLREIGEEVAYAARVAKANENPNIDVFHMPDLQWNPVDHLEQEEP